MVSSVKREKMNSFMNYFLDSYDVYQVTITYAGQEHQQDYLLNCATWIYASFPDVAKEIFSLDEILPTLMLTLKSYLLII